MAAAYLIFVFSSESFNPFTKPKIYTRRRAWRYGRTLAGGVFLASLVAFLCLIGGVLTLRSAALLAVVLWVVMSVALKLRFRMLS